MCTTSCPCDLSEDTTGEYAKLTKSDLTTQYPNRVDGMYFGTDKETLYSTFADCFSDSSKFTDDQDVVDQDIIDLVNYLEGEYKCSGVCDPGYFYWTLGLSSGIPTTTCVSVLEDNLGNAGRAFGVLLFLTTAIMIGMLLVQYVLWVSSKRN
jgi:hypothetical protein